MNLTIDNNLKEPNKYKMEKEDLVKIIIYVIMGIVVAGLVFLAFYPGTLQAWSDVGKSTEDKCKPGQGYTEESWREHMSHHPDIYKECLK